MPRSKHPDVTAEKILETSRQLFLEKGYDNTTIQDIVNELDGLSKGAIYHHFKSKPILKLVATIEENQQVLTPLWLELIEEGKQDGSIQTKYAKELSELLPLFIFWLSPSVYPNSVEELRYKFYFTMEMLTKIGLPLLNKDMKPLVERYLTDISNNSEVTNHA